MKTRTMAVDKQNHQISLSISKSVGFINFHLVIIVIVPGFHEGFICGCTQVDLLPVYPTGATSETVIFLDNTYIMSSSRWLKVDDFIDGHIFTPTHQRNIGVAIGLLVYLLNSCPSWPSGARFGLAIIYPDTGIIFIPDSFIVDQFEGTVFSRIFGCVPHFRKSIVF